MIRFQAYARRLARAFTELGEFAQRCEAELRKTPEYQAFLRSRERLEGQRLAGAAEWIAVKAHAQRMLVDYYKKFRGLEELQATAAAHSVIELVEDLHATGEHTGRYEMAAEKLRSMVRAAYDRMQERLEPKRIL